MKICPKCKSRTAEDIECHICGESLTYVEKAIEDREKIRFNKYYFFYLFRNCFFTLACIAALIIKNVIGKPVFGYSYFIIYGVALLSLVGSIFKRTFIKLNLSVCNRRYAEFTVNLFIIISGFISVILALAIW